MNSFDVFVIKGFTVVLISKIFDIGIYDICCRDIKISIFDFVTIRLNSLKNLDKNEVL